MHDNCEKSDGWQEAIEPALSEPLAADEINSCLAASPSVSSTDERIEALQETFEKACYQGLLAGFQRGCKFSPDYVLSHKKSGAGIGRLLAEFEPPPVPELPERNQELGDGQSLVPAVLNRGDAFASELFLYFEQVKLLDRCKVYITTEELDSVVDRIVSVFDRSFLAAFRFAVSVAMNIAERLVERVDIRVEERRNEWATDDFFLELFGPLIKHVDPVDAVDPAFAAAVHVETLRKALDPVRELSVINWIDDCYAFLCSIDKNAEIGKEFSIPKMLEVCMAIPERAKCVLDPARDAAMIQFIDAIKAVKDAEDRDLAKALETFAIALESASSTLDSDNAAAFERIRNTWTSVCERFDLAFESIAAKLSIQLPNSSTAVQKEPPID